MSDPKKQVEKPQPQAKRPQESAQVVSRKAHVQWALSFWKTWSWLAFLVGAILTALLWAASAACAPWFALGYLLALLVVAILCIWLWSPPSPPPPPGKRLRLINRDGRRHLKKLRLKLKLQPENQDWLSEPWQREYDLPMFTGSPSGLAPGAHWDFDPAPDEPIFGLLAEVDWEYVGGDPAAGTVCMENHFEKPEPIECGTLRFKGLLLDYLDGVILL